VRRNVPCGCGGGIPRRRTGRPRYIGCREGGRPR
jgi:hypothetical protein